MSASVTSPRKKAKTVAQTEGELTKASLTTKTGSERVSERHSWGVQLGLKGPNHV